MEDTRNEQPVRLEEALLRLLQGYGEHYEIRHHVTMDGKPVRAIAEMHIQEERRFFGIPMLGRKLAASESNEYVLFLLEERFTAAAAEKVIALAEAAEKELLRLHDGHAFSFFSAVALTGGVDKDAADRIKRHAHRGAYQPGWSMTRLAVIDLPAHKAIWNKDGKDLSRLTLARLAQS